LNIEIYTKDFCIWCDRAKTLLDSKDLDFKEIDLSDDTIRSEFYLKIGEGIKTVPQVFIDSKRIGGYQDLVRWFSNGI
jgi:glutaredoxin